MNKLSKSAKIILKSILFLFHTSKKMFLIMIILVTVCGFSTSIKLVIWKRILDFISEILSKNNTDFKMVICLLTLHFTVSIIQVLLSQIQLYIQNVFSKYVEKGIVVLTMSKVEKFELNDFEDSDNYNNIQKISNESHSRSMNIMRTIMQIIQGFATALGTVIVIWSFSKSAVILCIISAIPIFVINNKIMDKWFEIFNTRFEKIRFANYLKSMCFKYENIKELKLYNSNVFLKKKVVDIYDANIQQDKQIRKKFLVEMSLINTLDIVFTYVIKLIIILISYYRRLTIGTLVIYIQAIDVLKESTDSILTLCSQAYEDSLYMQLFFELKERKESYKGNIEFQRNFKCIKFVNVSFKYPNTNKYVIKNFNYVFYANKTYALVGLNGSGKTTLLKLLLGMYKVEEGEILIDGTNINLIDKASYHASISAIFQDFIKYPFTVRENITICDYKTDYDDSEVERVAKFSGIDRDIERFPDKYATRLQKEWKNSTELSLGQWQKIAISRAALKKAEILILDEPTASIDAMTESEMFNNFSSLKDNKLCILVTHRLSNIKIVDEILVLENGNLIENGNHAKLIENNKLYSKLFNLQVNAYEMTT